MWRNFCDHHQPEPLPLLKGPPHMPGILDHQSRETTKLLLIGRSGMGKTGSLISLAAAGYNLRILDLDNGMDILKDYTSNPKSPYKITDPNQRIRFITLTDSMEEVGGKTFPKKATVWQRSVQMLKDWKDGQEPDLGSILTWGPKDVLVVDSLSRLSDAALWFHLQMNGALRGTRTSMEARRDIGAVQSMLKNFFDQLRDKEVKCNVVVIAHVIYSDEDGLAPTPDKDGHMGTKFGYPAAIGRALSPRIPEYFNTMLIARTVGSGLGLKHKISTLGADAISAKSSAPLRVKAEYDLGTGLAEYFAAVRGEE